MRKKSFFYGAMSVLCCERNLREFRANSPLRNCFSKENSIASELPFSKKKSTYANGEIMCLPGESAYIKNDCEDTGRGIKGLITYLPVRVLKKILTILYPAFVSCFVGRGGGKHPLTRFDNIGKPYRFLASKSY